MKIENIISLALKYITEEKNYSKKDFEKYLRELKKEWKKGLKIRFKDKVKDMEIGLKGLDGFILDKLSDQ